MTEVNSLQFNKEGPDAQFNRALRDGHFKLQHCQYCSSYIYYPRLACNSCGSTDWLWVEVSGRAIVYSSSTPRLKPEQGGAYNISLVDLEEGPRMVSQVVDIAPEDVEIGMAVQAFISEIDDVPVVLFRPLVEVEQGVAL